MARMSRKKKKKAVQDAWTYRDEVLVETIRIVNDTMGGRVESRPSIATRFATNCQGERVVATGYYAWSWWGAVGDGSWSVGQSMVVGTGAIGMGLMVGSVIGNSRARRAAQQQAAMDATQCWRHVDQRRAGGVDSRRLPDGTGRPPVQPLDSDRPGRHRRTPVRPVQRNEFLRWVGPLEDAQRLGGACLRLLVSRPEPEPPAVAQRFLVPDRHDASTHQEVCERPARLDPAKLEGTAWPQPGGFRPGPGVIRSCRRNSQRGSL